MRTERPTCRECACNKVCEYFENENSGNLDETCPLCYWEKYFVPKQEWISVYDRCPNEDGKYLVYTRGERIHTSYFYRTNAYGFELCDVTHWMPLPEPPKMKGGAE